MTSALKFDRAHFAHMTGGDHALQEEVLALFRAQASDWDAALAAPDVEADWKSFAHKIKGSARGIGLPALAEACEAAEQAVGAERVGALAALRAALNDALAAIDSDD